MVDSIFYHSDTADKLGIFNYPSNVDFAKEIDRNLEHCTAIYLEFSSRYSALFGSRPFVITSGYRCEELNKLVGGQPNSLHMHGQAFDISLPKCKDSLFKLDSIECFKSLLYSTAVCYFFLKKIKVKIFIKTYPDRNFLHFQYKYI